MAKKRGKTAKQKRAAAARKRKGSIKSMVRKAVNTLASPVVFWQQLSSKDYEVLNADPAYRGLDYMGKLQVASNILTGSLTGRVLFPNHYNPSPNGSPRINPAGVINTYTGVGIAGLLYSKIGKSMKLPEASSIGAISKKVIFGSAVGGFFDPPSTSGLNQSTRGVSPVMARNRAVTSMNVYDQSTSGAFR